MKMWAKASLRNNFVFNPKKELLQFGQGSGGTPPEPPVDYLLNASFHRYGPAGPLVLNNGDVLDDTGTAAAEIDKGSLTMTIPATHSAVLEDTRLKITNASTTWNGARVEETAGLAVRQAGKTLIVRIGAANQVTAGYSWSLAGATGDGDMQYGVEIVGGNQFLKHRFSGSDNAWKINSGTFVNPTAYKFIQGGYSVTGEPDPAGAYGCLYLVGDVLTMSSNDASTDSVFPRSNAVAGTNEVDLMQQYVDPAPLATPHRSLFATDHADIADYTPEDGGGWTTVGGTVKTEVGVAKVDTLSTVVDALLDGTPSYIEASFNCNYGGNNQSGPYFRYLDQANYWRLSYQPSVQPQLRERTASTNYARATIPAGANVHPARFIVTDDGSEIVCIYASSGALATYQSTTGNDRTMFGFWSYSDGAGTDNAQCLWFCTRG